MAVTDKQIKSLKATGKKYKLSCGESLFVEVKPSGSASYRGRLKLLDGKTREFYIGMVEGISLKEARQQWRSLKADSGGEKQKAGSSQHTLEELADRWLMAAQCKQVTLNDYRNKIKADILPVLGADTPLAQLEWDRGGREKVMQMKDRIVERGSLEQANRVVQVARGMFNFAIVDLRWMKGENPALGSATLRTKRASQGHATISFDELPAFLIALEDCSSKQARIAVKLTLMCFVRVGALAQMQWDQIDLDRKLWVIPGDASGLKRDLETTNREHVVPLTNGMLKLIEQLRRINGHQKYCLPKQTHSSKLPHMSPSSVNRTIHRMGYAGECTAHGLRALVTTAGLERMDFRYEVLDALLGHISKGKIRGAYDRSEWLEQRREFLEAWEAVLIEVGLRLD